MILKNCYVSLGSASSFVVTSFVKSVKLEAAVQLQDNTVMGVNSKIMEGGIKEWSCDIEFAQNYSTGASGQVSIDEMLWTFVDNSTAIGICIRPTTASIGVTNPEYYGTVVAEKYPIVSGKVGDVATASVSFKSSGDLNRRTA